MKAHLVWILILVLGSGATAQAAAAGIAGTWEGESKCTVPLPCRDEHVVYEIKPDPQAADHFTVDAYKIVSGERNFMGTIECHYPPAPATMRCIGRRPGDVWTFTIAGNSMTGTLTVGAEKKLYRKVQVSRMQK